MRAVINGKRYDTEKAECIATYWNGAATSDFRYCEESLYRTPRGSWFLAGHGGPMSPYACELGDGMIGSGRGIRPLTREEAYDWLELHGMVEEIEEHFADMIEDA